MKQRSILLKSIEEQELWEKEVVLQRNEFLKVAGSIDTNLYFIVEGTIRIFIIDEDHEHTIRFGYKDNMIASLDSFISEKPSSYYIQTIKKTRLKIISKKGLNHLIAQSPELQVFWKMALEQIIFQQLEREQDLLISSPAERYKRVLDRSPQLFQEVPNKYIASYLRMTPETLSRLKKY